MDARYKVMLQNLIQVAERAPGCAHKDCIVCAENKIAIETAKAFLKGELNEEG